MMVGASLLLSLSSASSGAKEVRSFDLVLAGAPGRRTTGPLLVSGVLVSVQPTKRRKVSDQNASSG